MTADVITNVTAKTVHYTHSDTLLSQKPASKHLTADLIQLTAAEFTTSL